MRHPGLGEGARPDVFTFNSIMYGMASVGECERLLVVLDDMRAAGVPPDVVSYNTAMGACNKVGGRVGGFEAERAQGRSNERNVQQLLWFLCVHIVCRRFGGAFAIPEDRVVCRARFWLAPLNG